ncbi:hypothetical protein BXZ70DRAFT_895661 [Cristinia sonorae]|uniref:Uncharacterized protein n=1 Tax=Cristinia sonorae TaxID=1940300 RepID=A0A8K0UK53_9AGAR|nr:hypothetical protein BXZ70DRAFT_895661 [Cristinia sonorae]
MHDRPSLAFSSGNTSTTSPSPQQEDPDTEGGEISDQEWEIRTGRAIYILQTTLPSFFTTGLISSLTPSSDSDSPLPASHASTPSASLTDTLLSPFKDIGRGRNGEGKGKEKEKEGESIYSPRVRLEYKPPVMLPTPLPSTLRVEGLHLYIASSVFVRHTLNALYTDLKVDIRRARVHGRPRPKTSQNTRAQGGKNVYRCIRERSFQMGLGVTGAGRVSGTPAEWEINCTYTFSPITGLIHLHTIDSIEPAPHAALFEALGRFGLVGSGSAGERSAGGGTICKGGA